MHNLCGSADVFEKYNIEQTSYMLNNLQSYIVSLLSDVAFVDVT